MSVTVSATKRLLQDLKQLKEEPLVGISAEPFGENIMKWYGLVLAANGSPYAGIPIRFTLEFPNEYPREPAKAYFDTWMPYKAGSSFTDASGRFIVCLNLFGNFGHIQSVRDNISEGWSPSYTVQTILVSMQGLMMSSMLDKSKTKIQRMTEAAMNFKCPITKHNGYDATTWFPQVITNPKVAESIARRTGRVPFHPLRDFYICSTTKKNVADGALLGYGINIENNRIGTLTSPCEYVSREAFMDGVVRSSTNKPFKFWIPVLIQSNSWPRIRSQFFGAVHSIAQRITKVHPHATTSTKVLKVCSSVMNSLVVEIMNNERNATANDKFINAYLVFYRLLVQYAKDDPQLIQEADERLKDFIAYPGKRTKVHVENLGELLILLLVSQTYSWADIAEFFISESDARNFFWYAIGNNTARPWWPELAVESYVNGRAGKVFEATKASRNLIMFQVKFVKVAKNIDLQKVESNFGLAPEDTRFELKDLYNLVMTVECWDDFFNWLDMPVVSEGIRDEQLLEALRLSLKQGYHGVLASPRQHGQYASRTVPVNTGRRVFRGEVMYD